MSKRIGKEIIILSLAALLGCSSLSAQQEASEGVIAPDIIFSNLGPAPLGRYYTRFDHSLSVTGKRVSGETETWEAVRFTPRVDTQAKVLAAAIGYLSGTKRVNLGIYSDEDGTVGTVLPGSEGSTTGIPDVGECCQLAKVVLPGAGVALTGGSYYWLVASPDNSNAPDFEGGWQESNRAISANMNPPFAWNVAAGAWPAAQVRGTNIHSDSSPKAVNDGLLQPRNIASSGDEVVIYKNFGPPSERYYTNGLLVTGNDVPSRVEVWEAIPFIPRMDVHATVLAAAIGYVSGTKLVNLGIYSDDDGTVGALLPGAQASTTDIPGSDECCELARARLPGEGVALTAGTRYWLVASPDNKKAPDFYGQWQVSSAALGAYQQPEQFNYWTSESGLLLAAEIRGTLP